MTRIIIAAMLLACGPVAWAEPLLVLGADFEDQVVDEPIGLGGAALGQPRSVSSQLTAIVRDGIMPTRSLALAWADGSLPAAYSMSFQFLKDLEVSDGELVIELDIQPGLMSRYGLGLRESGGSSRTFGSIILQQNGNIRAGDLGTVLTDVTYSAGELLTVRWVHNLSARTYSLEIKGVVVFSHRPHPFADRGIGRMLFLLEANTPDDSVLHIDNIRVTWQPDAIFDDRFAVGLL